MKTNRKFIYAIAAFIAFKLLFLSLAINAGIFQSRSFILASAPASDPMEILFRLLFILFIVSPPLIVVLLFLIWRELKKRNNLK